MRTTSSWIIPLLIVSLSATLYAQNSPSANDAANAAQSPEGQAAAGAAAGLAPMFGLGLDIGYSNLPTGANGQTVGWQKIAFRPDLALGDFGVGLNLDINFRFDAGATGTDFEVRPEDWVPDSTHNVLEVYLPKIRYLRYAQKGAPLYVLLGNVENGLLGNGFIMGGYRNDVFSPQQRLFGLNFDLDGELFKFPYLGIETMIGNLAAFDVLGARIYSRPLAGIDAPIVKDLQVGFTFAADTNPRYFSPIAADKSNPDKEYAAIWGADVRLPILSSDVFSLSGFIDMASENSHIGVQTGLGGKILNVMNYLGLIRFLQENFIPSYFDSSYDVMREKKYAVLNATTEVVPAYDGWLFSLGFSVFDAALSFNATVDGPFQTDPNVPFLNPNLKGVLILKEGVIGGLSAQASYEKKNIVTFSDLISPVNAIVGAQIGYKFGPARLSLVYDLRYDPYSTRVDASTNQIQYWQVTSRLETSIELF